MKVDIKNWSGDVVGELSLPDEVFAKEVSEHMVWEVVNAFLASQRRGTHKVKGKGEVAGTGAKPWRQKGSGRARVGTRRSPLWRGGGVVHGPVPRDYTKKVNKKARRAALAGVVSQRLADGKLLVIDSMELEAPKTKAFTEKLAKLGLSDEKVLLVEYGENQNLYLASRNKTGVKALDAGRLNTYEVLNHRWVIVSQRAVEKLKEVLS